MIGMVNSEIEIFKSRMLSSCIVEQFDLRYEEKIEIYKDLLGTNYTLTFHNNKRRFDLTLCLVFDNNVLGDRINITIGKKDDINIDEDPWFLITDWLRKNSEEDKRDFFYLNSYEGTFEQRIILFFVFLEELFQHDDLIGILKGDKWINFHFDWRGMK